MTAPRYALMLSCSVSVAIAIYFVLQALQIDYLLARDLAISRGTGYAALGFLFASLSMTPLRRLGKRLGNGWLRGATWMALRRTFGMAAAWWALVHAAWTLEHYLDNTWASVVHEPYLRAGLVTLLILALLLLTSFPRLVKQLRIRLWKQLHVLAYLAAFFLLQHLLLSPFAPRRRTIVIFAALLAVATLRLVPTVMASRQADRLGS